MVTTRLNIHIRRVVCVALYKINGTRQTTDLPRWVQIFGVIDKYQKLTKMTSLHINSLDTILFFTKKGLKIPKDQSEAVKQGKTDNTMSKIKRTNNDLQNIKDYKCI